MSLSYSRTIHKFQGLSAGPVDVGKIPNMYSVILCDPDAGSREASCTGLFYTALSRATTLGDCSGKGSAIYFFGPHFNYDRIKYLTKRQDGVTDYFNVTERRHWVAHLDANTVATPSNMRTKNGKIKKIYGRLLDWVSTERISYQHLIDRIDAYVLSRVHSIRRQDFACLFEI